MKTGSEGIELMHHFESCELEAYPDPATGGAPWTIGWGETGPHVKEGMTITQQEADEMFERRLAKEFEPGVESSIRSGATQNQFDALVALAYNIGLGNLKSSTLLRMHNDREFVDAEKQFIRWNKAAGKTMKGLSRRRTAESCVYAGMTAEEGISIGMSLYP